MLFKYGFSSWPLVSPVVDSSCANKEIVLAPSLLLTRSFFILSYLLLLPPYSLEPNIGPALNDFWLRTALLVKNGWFFSGSSLRVRPCAIFEKQRTCLWEEGSGGTLSSTFNFYLLAYIFHLFVFSTSLKNGSFLILNLSWLVFLSLKNLDIEVFETYGLISLVLLILSIFLKLSDDGLFLRSINIFYI